MSHVKARGKRPLTDNEIREFYVRGVFRNLFAVVSAKFEGEIDQAGLIHQRNIDRGDISFAFVDYLLEFESLGSLSKKILGTFKSHKQGSVPYHELGLAHSLLCTFQYANLGQHDRHSVAINTSMALGRVIKPLDELTVKIFQKYTLTQFTRLSDHDLESAFPDEFLALKNALRQVAKSYPKLHKLKELQQSYHRLVGAFSIVKASGVDKRRPFEKFLETR